MYFSHLAISALVVLLFGFVITKPLNRGPPHPNPVEENSPEDKFDLGLPYEHYLKQVVEELEKDEEFKRKLETANLTDIKSGNIATYLELVNHTIRSNLDELKRREIRRLQELSIRHQQNNGVERFQIDHLDKKNLHKFGVEDLRVLIKTATSDLEAIDEERQKEFKEHELDKEAHKRQKLDHMAPEERKKEEERLQEVEGRHKKHPKVHHPGSKDQMEEVWDKSDHLEEQEFDPKTFFMTHDLNGDFHWNIEEIDAVLQVELNKVYDPNNPTEEDDPLERDEEMDRMRKHIMTEMDKDRDMFISMEEFLAYTGVHGENPEFQKDEGWKTIDEQDPVYTDKELEEYLKQFEQQPGVVHDLPHQDMTFKPEQHGGQQQFQPPQQQQQQFQPPQQQQQQFQPPQQQQQQFQPPQQQQQFQPPQQLNQEQLQKQLQELQEKLNQQQQQHQQQQPNLVGQPPQQGQVPVGH